MQPVSPRRSPWDPGTAQLAQEPGAALAAELVVKGPLKIKEEEDLGGFRWLQMRCEHIQLLLSPKAPYEEWPGQNWSFWCVTIHQRPQIRAGLTRCMVFG